MVRAAVILHVLVLAGCAPTIERVLARDGDPDAGAAVFAEHCAECHAADGSGGVGPDLRNDDDTPAELADKVLWGWGAMEGMRDELSTREAADVIAFVLRDIEGSAQVAGVTPAGPGAPVR
jgi:cytochrome c oxidase cbb3-type subunit 3